MTRSGGVLRLGTTWDVQDWSLLVDSFTAKSVFLLPLITLMTSYLHMYTAELDDPSLRDTCCLL